jgi:hypothetical protein
LLEGVKGTSIWQKPLGKNFWAFVFAIILVGVMLVGFFPLLRATIEWSGHPSVDYRGVTLRLPFGWVYSQGDLPLTVKKPWPSSLTGLESSLLIQKADVSGAQRDLLINEWAKLHASSSLWTDINVPMTMPSDGPGLSLRCSHQNVARGSVVRLECLSGDAAWSFRFLVRQSDMEQAEGIMRNVLVGATVSR